MEEEEEKNDHEELDIQDLAQSSLEDENKSMADLDEFKLPEIDFESTDVELEDQVHEEEIQEEESISVRSEREGEYFDDDQQSFVSENEETTQEIPEMSPMAETELEQEEAPENDFPVDEAKIDFQSTEQNQVMLEQSYDLGETIAEKTEVAIIETVATDRLTDIRKEYETYGLQPSVEGPKVITDTKMESRGVMASTPMDFDADKFPPEMGAGTPPASSAFFKVRGSPDIKVGENPFGYA